MLSCRTWIMSRASGHDVPPHEVHAGCGERRRAVPPASIRIPQNQPRVETKGREGVSGRRGGGEVAETEVDPKRRLDGPPKSAEVRPGACGPAPLTRCAAPRRTSAPGAVRFLPFPQRAHRRVHDADGLSRLTKVDSTMGTTAPTPAPSPHQRLTQL